MRPPFRPKKLDIGGYVNVRVLRDHSKRIAFEQYETQRQALRYAVRNTTLPMRVRLEAQLQLSKMHGYTNPVKLNNRCTIGGWGRGVMSDFKLNRYVFRMQALEGNLPGVKKASW